VAAIESHRTLLHVACIRIAIPIQTEILSMTALFEYAPLKGSRRYTRSGLVVLRRANENEWCEVTLSAHRKAPLPEPAAPPMSLLWQVIHYQKEGSGL
jgi:hypothetical protein